MKLKIQFAKIRFPEITQTAAHHIMKINLGRRVLPIVACSTLLSAQLQAQTVAWGSSANFNPISFTSNGSVDNLTWQIGWFNNGYTPTFSNYATWASNWNGVSSLTPEPEIGNPGNLVNFPYYKDFDGLWAVSVNTYDVGALAAGKQMYTFAFNDMSKIGTPLGEVLLYREDGLLFPTVPNQVTFDIADNPLDTNDDPFTVIWGQVDRQVYGAGGMLVGGGIYSDLKLDSNTQPPNNGFGTFESQSFTWPTPIPEPSVAILGCFGMMALLRRHRSRSH